MQSSPPAAWDADGNFEEGTGEVPAAPQWRCEWSSAYVIAADLAEWGDLRPVRDHFDSETHSMWLERVIETARSGDDATLRAIQAECTLGAKKQPTAAVVLGGEREEDARRVIG